MDEGARLESVWTGNCLQGSNPCLSAIFKGIAVLDGEVAVPCTRKPLQRGRIPAPGFSLWGPAPVRGVDDWVSCDGAS